MAAKTASAPTATPKKKNPADLTMRNSRHLQRQIDNLKRYGRITRQMAREAKQTAQAAVERRKQERRASATVGS